MAAAVLLVMLLPAGAHAEPVAGFRFGDPTVTAEWTSVDAEGVISTVRVEAVDGWRVGIGPKDDLPPTWDEHWVSVHISQYKPGEVSETGEPVVRFSVFAWDYDSCEISVSDDLSAGFVKGVVPAFSSDGPVEIQLDLTWAATDKAVRSTTVDHEGGELWVERSVERAAVADGALVVNGNDWVVDSNEAASITCMEGVTVWH